MNRLICFLHYKLRNKVSDQNLCVTRWERTSRNESKMIGSNCRAKDESEVLVIL